MSKPSTIRKTLERLKSELNDYHTRYYKREIPDVMTFTDLQEQVVAEALTAIEQALLGKAEEFESIEFEEPVTTDAVPVEAIRELFEGEVL